MYASRPPCPALRPWVRLLWAGSSAGGTPHREHVLPTGAMHLALRLDGPPLRLYEGAGDPHGTQLGHAVVGGARDTYYLRDTGQPGDSVGAQLEPGAAHALFAATAEELAGRHTLLGDLWGSEAAQLLEQLQAVRGAAARMDLLQAHLLHRLRGALLHPAVAAALGRLRAGASVAQAVRAGGLSHRHLVLRFREATGLAPKQHARVLRLQDALAGLAQEGMGIADVALQAGFADQAHFAREFRAFAGMTPGDWRRLAPAHTHHVPAPQVRFLQDGATARP